MPENRLVEIGKLQKKVQRWFWLSCPWGAGVLAETIRTGPQVVNYFTEGKTGPFPNTLPFALLFAAWWILYERAELRLINLERKNFAFAQTHGRLAVQYGFPERFIEKINLMHIKLRQPEYRSL